MDSEAILWKVIVEDLLSLVSTDQTANNGFLQDSSVGKGLSKDDKAQKLALQHWLEAEIAAASRHRCGHNLGEEEDVLFHGVGTLQGVCEIRIRILGSRNRDIRNSKQAEDHNIGEAKKMSIHWNSLIFMVTSYQRIGRAFEATTISLYKLHTALSQNHFAAPTGSKLLTCNCLNKEQMNTKGNRVSQLDNNHESHVAVVLDIILMEDGRVQLQDNSTGCDLNNHKIIKLVLGTGETALNTAERTGNSDVEGILVEHGTVQSAKAMKAQPATAIAREFKQTVSDIKHEVHHLMEALNCWAQLDDNLTLCDLINNNHKETVPRDPAVFQHHDNTFNDQHMRKKTARRVSSFVVSTVVFLGILFDVIQVQQPLRKERDPVSMWPTLLGLFGLMVFVWAVAIMILVGSPIFTRMHTAMLLFWAILMLLQSANTTGSLGILFMGWYAYALGEATTK